MWNSIQLSPEGKVNNGGYIPRREASRYISTALLRPWGDSCFSIYQMRWIKKCRFINGHHFLFWNFRERRAIFSPFAKQWISSEYPRIVQVTGANQNGRKLLSTDFVYTNGASRLGIYPPLFTSPSGDSCILYRSTLYLFVRTELPSKEVETKGQQNLVSIKLIGVKSPPWRDKERTIHCRKHENLVSSNELIKVELPPWKIWRADVSSVSFPNLLRW